eukprot:CAMPEP_0198230458 /NCGR_PEP_ID=MMETSP1445-20131203/114675_1 /TAXON_ID=36898 /ORGANISM="Pyramimonas sp., Strain CCMP2087" /LENGTH=93 /DNA_ID=CAMNT_0043911001 /DNA_START=1516 /DNA_END=1794 /DNA_ORIENTATION=+
MAAEDQFLLLPSVASFRHPPPILGSSSSSQRQLLTQGACIGWTQVDAGAEVDPEMEAKFLSNTVHNAMAVCSSLRYNMAPFINCDDDDEKPVW